MVSHIFIEALFVFLFRDIQNRARYHDGRSVAFTHGFPDRFEPTIFPVFMLQPVFEIEGGIPAVIAYMGSKGVQRFLLVLRMQLIALGIQCVGEIRFIPVSQEFSELLGPPKRIIRVGGIFADNIHAPRAFG